jgi:hypothetical protein
MLAITHARKKFRLDAVGRTFRKFPLDSLTLRKKIQRKYFIQSLGQITFLRLIFTSTN